MFDRAACPDAEPLAARPFVSMTALSALSVLLDLALKGRTPSAALFSGVSRGSHDQNRGETHVTADPTQSTTTVAAADGSVRERSVERHRRRAQMAGAPAEARAVLMSLMTQLILDQCCDDNNDAAHEGGSHDL
jgi:hypothetical protein